MTPLIRRKPRVYLAGRMNHQDPSDAQWRRDLTPFLEELGFEVLDPFRFEPHQLKGLKPGRLPDGMTHWYELRNAKEPHLRERFLRYMRRIVKYDINVIRSEADYIVALWSEGCRSGAGTHSELTIAFDLGKPVYLVAQAEVPAWTVGCCDKIFDTFEELRTFLQEEFEEEAAALAAAHAETSKPTS